MIKNTRLIYEQYQHACQKVIPSAFIKDRTSWNKPKNTVNMTKKEDFKFKLSTTVVLKV